MKKYKLHLKLFLMFIVTLAIVCFLFNGAKYIGKSYYDSSYFESETQQYLEGLNHYVLNPLLEEELREKVLTVTDEEVDYYRNYYGTLADQIQSIKYQYEEQLNTDTDEVLDEEVVALLKAERDEKIAAIKANFVDRDKVEGEIIALKTKALNAYMKSFEEGKKSFLKNYNYFVYDFVNVESGEAFSNGNVDKRAVFTKKFEEGVHYTWHTESETIYLNEYGDGEWALMGKSYDFPRVSKAFTGTIAIPHAILGKTDIGQDIGAFQFTKYAYFVLYIFGLVSLVLLVKVWKPTRKDFFIWEDARQLIGKFPADVVAAAIFLVAWFTLIMMDSMIGSIHSFGYYGVEMYDLTNSVELGIQTIITFMLFCAVVVNIEWLRSRFSGATNMDAMWQNTFAVKFAEVTQNLFLNRSIGIQTMMMFSVFFLAGVGFLGIGLEFSLILIYIPLVVLVLLPTLFTFMRRMGYLNRIMAQTKDMAEGRLTGELDVKGKSVFAEHAANLNALRDGVRSSMTEQAKSERMKTELITNVSHDLRTPLTSIITYTDLLKNPDLTEEERQKYVGILDVKSARLKTLIEDLFEVSKMASGNVELMKQQVDLAQLLIQAAGEHAEDFIAANLDLRVSIAEQPIFAYVDGQKWWRVIDNLIINARKYALEGTRVYVNLKQVNGIAELTVKNVAKYELNEEATELIERFKRADTSRHTEGSGLGLAIAQSIVDLHNGSMAVAVDGDLFKVTVTVRSAN